jgi:protease I
LSERRRCQDCGKPMADLNPGTRCYACTPDEFSVQGPRRRRRALPHDEIISTYRAVRDTTQVAHLLGLPRSSVWYVIKRAKAASEDGARVVAIAPADGAAAGLAGRVRDCLDTLQIASVTLDATAESSAADIDVLVLADPARSTEPRWESLVRETIQRGGVVAALSGAAETLAAADAIRDRTVTSYPGGRSVLERAGARWSDDEVCADGLVVTAQGPEHLARFCTELARRLNVETTSARLDDALDQSFPASDPPQQIRGGRES